MSGRMYHYIHVEQLNIYMYSKFFEIITDKSQYRNGNVYYISDIIPVVL